MGLGKKVVKFLIALIAGVQVKFVEGQIILRNRKNGRYITISKRAYDSECVNKNNAYADFDVVPVSAENAHDIDGEEVEAKPKRKAKADNA